MIVAYFGAEGSEPDYEVPVIEEMGDPAWTPLEATHMGIATHPREVVENIADFAHCGPVHKTYIDDFQVIIDGPRATQRSIGYGYGLKGQRIDLVSVATYHGPAIQFTRLTDVMKHECTTRHVATVIAYRRGGTFDVEFVAVPPDQ